MRNLLILVGIDTGINPWKLEETLKSSLPSDTQCVVMPNRLPGFTIYQLAPDVAGRLLTELEMNDLLSALKAEPIEPISV